MENAIVFVPFAAGEPTQNFSLFDLLFPPMQPYQPQPQDHGFSLMDLLFPPPPRFNQQPHDEPHQNPPFMFDFMECFNKHLMLFVRNLTEFLSQLLYIFRVSPVKAFNKIRTDYCEQFPAYGTDEFLNMANEHPLRVVYCSHWLSKRIKFLEEMFLAPYTLFTMMSDELNRMIYGQPEEIMPVPMPAPSTKPVAKPLPAEFVPPVEVSEITAVESPIQIVEEIEQPIEPAVIVTEHAVAF